MCRSAPRGLSWASWDLIFVYVCLFSDDTSCEHISCYFFLSSSFRIIIVALVLVVIIIIINIIMYFCSLCLPFPNFENANPFSRID